MNFKSKDDKVGSFQKGIGVGWGWGGKGWWTGLGGRMRIEFNIRPEFFLCLGRVLFLIKRMLLWVSDLDLLQARNYVHADWLRKSEADAVIIVVASSYL